MNELEAEVARLKSEIEGLKIFLKAADLTANIAFKNYVFAERRGFEGGWWKGRLNKGKCLCDGSCYDDFIADDYKEWEAQNRGK